jgi:Metallo-peptidase family M12
LLCACVFEEHQNLYFIKYKHCSMTILFAFLCMTACASAKAAVVENSTLFSNAEYVDCKAENGTGVVLQCKKDVESKIDMADTLSTANFAKKADLDCSKLELKGELDTVTITWFGEEITAVRKHFSSYPQLQGRHVWVGELVAEKVGSLTVVWNDACDPDVFQLDVVLNDDNESSKYSIKTTACTGKNDSPTCTWMTLVKTEERDEMERDEHPSRHLLEQHHTDETRALDAEIALLSQMDSTERGRRLLDNGEEGGTVLMDSGRRLDDGSVLKVLWMYTPQARAVYGEATLRSMIAAGVSTANLALVNSGIKLKIVCVGMFATEGYNTNDHMQTLDDLNNGRVPGVLRKRNLYKADLVQVVIQDSSYCGYGSLMQTPSVAFEKYGYSTVFAGCFSNLSNLHELLHNLGANHDRSSAGAVADGSTNYGYRYCDKPGSFRTVMSYSCPSSTRVPYISSPNLWYMGRRTGSAEADNVSTIKKALWTASNFRLG